MKEIHALLLADGNNTLNPEMPETEEAFFKRLFSFNRGKESKSKSDVVQVITANTESRVEAMPMLQDMTEQDILAGVEQTRLGKTPEAWKNANSKEVSAIIETVFDSYVDNAEQEALREAQLLRDEAGGNFLQQSEFVLDNYSSIDDIIDQSKRQLAELGVSPEALSDIETKFVGRILDEEFSAKKVREVIRSMPNNNPYTGNIKPGTQAEARYVEQIQLKIYDILAQESPEIARHMPKLRSSSEGMLVRDEVKERKTPDDQSREYIGKSLK